MTTADLLSSLSKKDIKLWLEGENLRFSAPEGVFTDEIKQQIVTQKPAIIAFLKSVAQAQLKASQGTIPRADRSAPLPLSFAQQRMWLLQQLDPDSNAYHMPTALNLVGELDIKALSQAFGELINRHESLRTCYIETDDDPVQIIQEPVKHFALEVDEVSVKPNKNSIDQVTEADLLKNRIAKFNTQPFDLTSDNMIRVKLLKLGSTDEHLGQAEQSDKTTQRYVLLISLHHICSDGWSTGIMVKEIAGLYQAYSQQLASPFAPLDIQYADYAQWQRDWLQGEKLEQQVSYWQTQLKSAPLLEMPSDFKRPPELTGAGNNVHFALSPEISAKLTRVCQAEKVTPFVLLLAAYYCLLHKYSGQQDICIGTPVANREREELYPIIGLFLNTLVLRINTEEKSAEEQASFKALLKAVQSAQLAAFDHQDLPFEAVVDALDLPQDLSHTPLFQAFFVLQNNEAPTALNLAKVDFSLIELEHKTSKYDLTLAMGEQQGVYEGGLEYNTDLFSKETAEKLLNHFKQLLEALLNEVDTPIDQIQLLSKAEVDQQVYEWNQTQIAVDTNTTIQERFQNQVITTPDAIAVYFKEQSITYAQIDAQANQIANLLVGLGTKPGDRVAFCFDRHSSLIPSLLGILKAGATYVPLDSAYPKDRLSYMIDDSNISIILCRSELVEQLPQSNAHIIAVDTDQRISSQATSAPSVQYDQDQLLYVIYTSGSTGTPKCTGAYQRSELNLLHWYTQEFGMNPSQRVLLISALGFDLTQKNFFAPLLNGAAVVIPDMDHYDDDLLRTLIAKHGITWLNCAPSMFYPLLDSPEINTTNNPLKTLKNVFLGGEPIQYQLLRNWHVNSQSSLINSYGPTECTDIACYHVVDKNAAANQNIPLGKANYNVRLYVLDKQHKVLPTGAVGELYIGGAGVGPGYLNDEKQTKRSFIQNPYTTEKDTLYATGDLVYFDREANLHFLGRADNQVKLRGLRIELGEIENALLENVNIKQAHVCVHHHEIDGNDKSNESLVAYISPAPADDASNLDTTAAIDNIKAALKEKLPAYMVPEHFIPLDALPLTANGKVDRKALPAPDFLSKGATVYVAPENSIEERLVEIWQAVLKRDPIEEKIGVLDDFFKLGGHSIIAAKAMSRIRKEFEISVPLRTLFRDPTIRGIASHIAASSASGGCSAIEAIPTVDRHQALPLSFAQQRAWVVQHLDPSSTAYNMPIALRLSGKINIHALEEAILVLMRRHESLRTRFVERDGDISQIIDTIDANQTHWPIPVEDISHLASSLQDTRILSEATAEANKPFNLADDCLVRTRLLKLNTEDKPTDYVLLATKHHIISDGWSMGIFLREFSAAYHAIATQSELMLEPLSVQYADYAAWQRAHLTGERLEQQLDFWKDNLQGVPLLELPTDRPRPAELTSNGGAVAVELDSSLSASISKYCQQQGLTPMVFLLSAYYLLLYKYSGQKDLCVGTPVANRDHPDIENIIGFFINVLALRTRLNTNMGFESLLKQVNDNNLNAFAHQDLSLEKLIEALKLRPDLSRDNPLFQTMFVMQNNELDASQMLSQDALAGMQIKQVQSDHTTAKYDLTLTLSDLDGCWMGGFEYNTDLFNTNTIEQLAEHYKSILQAVVNDPRLALNAINLLSDPEREQQLVLWNQNQEPYQKDFYLHQQFEQQAAHTPNATAIEFDAQIITYSQLNELSNQVAHHLVSKGINSGDRVGICFSRHPYWIVSILAALKAGASYVPLDANYPKERLSYMIKDSQISILLTLNSLVSKLPQEVCELISLDKAEDTDDILENFSLSHLATNNLNTSITPNQLIYVIYTSGSTGLPKCTGAYHYSAINLIHWYTQAFSMNANDAILLLSAVGFDLTQKNLFAPLCSGARIVIPNMDNYDHELLLDLIQEKKISWINCAPSAFYPLQEDSDSHHKLASLQKVFLGGEPIQISRLQPWLSRSSCSLINSYGPTECTDIASYQMLDNKSLSNKVSIGKPNYNVRNYILDEHNQLLPLGAVGELCIAGDGVGPGYLNDPDKTAQAFFENPFQITSSDSQSESDSDVINGKLDIINDKSDQTDRFYRTGDLAKYLPDGSIELLGRKDNQVKLHGLRIELDEITHALNKLPEIKEATVIVDQEQQRLVAYIVPNAATKNIDTDSLRQQLLLSLPEFMAPKVYDTLSALPLTPNGKVDTKALPKPNATLASAAPFKAAETEIQQQLIDIWQNLLSVEKIGINDNFFDIGGHSIAATQAVSRIRKQFNVQLPLRLLFQEPTVAAIAIAIENGKQADMPVIQAVPRSELMPLSFNQQQLWIVHQLEPDSSAYNMPAAVRITGPLDIDKVQQAFGMLIERHEVLRTSIVESDGEGWQKIHSSNEVQVPFTLIDIRDERTTATPETQIKQLVLAERNKAFDISQPPLFRVTVLKTAEQSHVVMVTLHHIISDGWSMTIFFDEFSRFYAGLNSNKPYDPAPLELHYADFAVWQRELLKDEALERLTAYWQSKLDPDGFVLNLPTDYQRGSGSSDAGVFQGIQINNEITEQFKLLNSQYGTTLYMGLLSVFQVLLTRLSGQSIINIGSPSAGRGQEETEVLLGFFINTMVLSVDCKGPVSFEQLLQKTKQAALDAYSHEDTPFEKIVEAVNPVRDMSRTPLFQVFFNFLNLPVSKESVDDLSIETLPDIAVEQSSKFDITLYASESDEGLELSMLYNQNLFKESSITALLEKFRLLMTAAIEQPKRNIHSYDLRLPSQNFTVDLTQQIASKTFKHPLAAIQEYANRKPNRVVIKDSYDNWTYSDLDKISNWVANHLLKTHLQSKPAANNTTEKGSPSPCVAIYGPKSGALVAAIIACAKAKQAFVLLDPHYPAIRLAQTLTEAKPTAIISIGKENLPPAVQEQFASSLQWQTRLSLITKENQISEQCNEPTPTHCTINKSAPNSSTITKSTMDQTELAYLTFTSGTKGKPKGIKNSWAPLAHFLEWYTKAFDLKSTDRFSMLSGIAHDPILRDIFTPLSIGASVRIPPETVTTQSDTLLAWLKREQVSVAHLTPALAELMKIGADELKSNINPHKANFKLPKLRLAMLGGEAVKPYTVEFLHGLAPNVRTMNCYGTSETPQVIACAEVHRNAVDEINLGRGIDDVQLCLLNEEKMIATPGEMGELYVRTPYLATGYLNEALNHDSFIINPFTQDANDRLYKTGDSGRYTQNGAVIYAGRKDDQVNIRGYRIETAEIDQALSAIETVSQSITLLSETTEGDAYLVSYIVLATQADHANYADALRMSLSSVLPDYMLPSAFIAVESIPLTPNGKIDKRQLPQVDDYFLTNEVYQAPETEVEKVVAEIWESILKREKISTTANFFNIGGHSLMAVKIVALVKQRYDVEFTLKTLFEVSTIAGMAAYVENVLWLRESHQDQESNQVSGSDDDDMEEFEL